MANHLHLETLEGRNLPSGAPVFVNAVQQLIVQGTRFADTVHVSLDGDQVVVDYNGTDYTFDVSEIAQIVFNGAAGNDVCENATAIAAILRGGAGNDSLTGGEAADRLLGGIGRDLLDGLGGNDSCFGGLAADLLDGGIGDDWLNGNAGADRLFGGLGDDWCQGAAGFDAVSGGFGDDTEFGELLNFDIGLVALLTNDSGGLGVAEWNDNTDDFQLLVAGLAANTTFDVLVDGNVVGQITTDEHGLGNLELSDVSFTVAAGTPIAVGDLNGTFADLDLQLPLVAAMVGEGGELGGGTYDATAGVFTSGVLFAGPETTYTVSIDVLGDGTFVDVGEITTNFLGFGNLLIDPLPGGFPAIQVGSVLKIGDILQGTFENVEL